MYETQVDYVENVSTALENRRLYLKFYFYFKLWWLQKMPFGETVLLPAYS